MTVNCAVYSHARYQSVSFCDTSDGEPLCLSAGKPIFEA
jgi:hypothetical protein